MLDVLSVRQHSAANVHLHHEDVEDHQANQADNCHQPPAAVMAHSRSKPRTDTVCLAVSCSNSQLEMHNCDKHVAIHILVQTVNHDP